MKWNVATKIASGFGAAVAIFLVVGATSYQSIGELSAAAEQRRHSFELVVQLADLLSLAKDVETGQRGFVITGDPAYLEPYLVAERAIDSRLAALRKAVAGEPAKAQRLEAIAPIVATRLALASKTIAARRSGGFEAAAALVARGDGKQAMDQIRLDIGAMQTDEERVLQQRVQQVENNVRKAHWTMGLGLLAGTLLAALVGFVISRSIAGRLQTLTTVARQLGTGDLTIDIPADRSSDEVGELSRSFAEMTVSMQTMVAAAERVSSGDLRTTIQPRSPNDRIGNALAAMVVNLRDQMRQLGEGTSVIASSASQIVTSTSELAASASESAVAISQTTTTVEEVRQTAQVASDKARVVADSAQRAALNAQAGRRATDDVAAGMARIREQMDTIGASMTRLSEQGQAIGHIVASVEDLAAQSKLLAVNAAIEAAKAGEHGRGFGVVAQEVKSLAEQSRQATNEVRGLLGDIQKATGAAVMAIEQGGKAVDAGSRQSEAAGDAIRVLAESVQEAAQSAMQIAASSQQQIVGVDQVAGAMHSIQQATAQNVSAAQQMADAARNLKGLGQRLQQIVARYQTEAQAPSL